MSEEKKEEILGKEKDLEEKELEEVAGGDSCICALGGGGTGTEGWGEKTCACVLGGGGEYTKGGMRCMCLGAGGGDSAQIYFR